MSFYNVASSRSFIPASYPNGLLSNNFLKPAPLAMPVAGFLQPRARRSGFLPPAVSANFRSNPDPLAGKSLPEASDSMRRLPTGVLKDRASASSRTFVPENHASQLSAGISDPNEEVFIHACQMLVNAFEGQEVTENALLACFKGADCHPPLLHQALTAQTPHAAHTLATLFIILRSAYALKIISRSSLTESLAARGDKGIPGLMAALRDNCPINVGAYVKALNLFAPALTLEELTGLLSARNSLNKTGVEAALTYADARQKTTENLAAFKVYCDEVSALQTAFTRTSPSDPAPIDESKRFNTLKVLALTAFPERHYPSPVSIQK